MRGVAAAAGVDPALVHHYFGGKDELFVAALELPVDPREVLAPVRRGRAGRRPASGWCAVFLAVWDDPERQRRPARPGPRAGRPTTRRPAAARVPPGGLRPRRAPALGRDRPELRMPLVASQMRRARSSRRYVLELEPLASMPADDVVAAVGPTLQRYLTGDLALA